MTNPLHEAALEYHRQPTHGKTSSSGIALEMRFGTEGLHVAMQQPSFDDWKFWEQFGRLGETLALRLAARS
jgi:hypothetical protein